MVGAQSATGWPSSATHAHVHHYSAVRHDISLIFTSLFAGFWKNFVPNKRNFEHVPEEALIGAKGEQLNDSDESTTMEAGSLFPFPFPFLIIR